RDQVNIPENQTLLDDWISDTYCPNDGGNGAYIGYSGNVLLPNFLVDSIFYLLQSSVDISEEFEAVVSTGIHLHTVSYPDGNVPLLLNQEKVIDAVLAPGHLTAGLNEAQNAWWFIVAPYNTNTYQTYSLDSLGQVTLVQEITVGGAIATTSNWDIGQAVFSPDMSLWANNTEQNGILLFDFDNTTGELSNYREIHYPNMDLATGLCFSPSGRFLYTTSGDYLYQIDLHSTDTLGRVYDLGFERFPSPTDGWPVGLGYMFTGPDCRIYVSPGTSSDFLHVIFAPDLLQEDCQFVSGAIQSPTNLAFNLPNLPNYRYLTGCDPTIGWDIPVSTEAPEVEKPIRIFPNPSTGQSQLTLPSGHSYTDLQVLDINGRVVQQQVISTTEHMLTLDAVALPVGTYVVRLQYAGGADFLRWVVQ
ncbi:MAG: T9SS type A sorting domain-containing protein, partial [Bacteroidota bacterium]